MSGRYDPSMTLPDNPATPFVHAADDIPRIELGRARAGLVATGSQTAGAYGLFRWDMTAEEPTAYPAGAGSSRTKSGMRRFVRRW